MKDCNKNIYQKIQDYLARCLDTYVEIVVEYKNENGRSQHHIIQYNRLADGTWIGDCGNMFDYDFFDIKVVISFVPFCQLSPKENSVIVADCDDDDDEIFTGIDIDHLRKIDASEIKEGDYICIDGESSFCETSYLKIINVEPRITWEVAKPEEDKIFNIVNYFLLTDEDWDTWSTLNGTCVSNEDSMYSAVGYYRYDENYSRKNEIEKLSEENAQLPTNLIDYAYIAETLFDELLNKHNKDN